MESSAILSILVVAGIGLVIRGLKTWNKLDRKLDDKDQMS